MNLGTGISKSDLLDWGAASTAQVKKDSPDAIVFFLGANEGFPFEGAAGKSVDCCGPAWAAQYATRARRMMQTYRQDSAARVYWLTLPMPRSPARQKIARTVNAAIVAAAQPFRAQVRILDMVGAVHAGRQVPRVDARRRHAARSSASPTASTSTRPAPNLAADLVVARLQADFASLGG